MTISCTAFAGTRKLTSGSIEDVARIAQAAQDAGETVLVFDDADGRLVYFDQRARPASAPVAQRGPGRPKLGVVPKEVTLLPRHWEWLGAQPGGASVALRKLVETAMRDPSGLDRVRAAREATYRFMTALAGDAPGYEEALRCLFAGDRQGFEEAIRDWPRDIVRHARSQAEPSFPAI